VFTFGESAGGALALTVGYAAAGGRPMSSCGGTMPRVRAVSAEYPALDPVTFYDNPNPLLGGMARQMVGQYLGGSPREYPARAHSVASASYIVPQAPPTLTFIADNDHLVPIAGAPQFIDEATTAGVAGRTVRFPWADHAVNLQYYGVTNQAMVQITLQHFCELAVDVDRSNHDTLRGWLLEGLAFRVRVHQISILCRDFVFSWPAVFVASWPVSITYLVSPHARIDRPRRL
jgi:acetyl esterase/lipase